MQPPRTPPRPQHTARRHRRHLWPRLFGTGLALWLATVAVTLATSNPTLLPTVILLGSFLVPVTFVCWAYERSRTVPGSGIGPEALFFGFIVGGVLGVLGASLLESYLLRQAAFVYLGVGLIEEGVKAGVLMLTARGLASASPRDGLVLGATVGFGFAAFESAGYALNALVTQRGLDLMALVQTEILRGLLAPVGHGLWTAILGGVLFAASAPGHWRITLRVLLTFLGVSLLHALWDSVHAIAAILAFLFTGTYWQAQLLEQGRVPPFTPVQAALVPLLDFAGMALVAAVGVGWLAALVRGWNRPAARRT
ncbi:PrsW family intramembrane metalloprotease [Nocardiopsis composta]|uniref:RsiW-degrading membrane proteinase PrsW (M82 family) n=1 Tax=Nocardiopsis composta TaxID=157465 RepID=A0A7W8QQV8_9ACTN|nr:PrsW family glutamic-type intramembrane protease [Nocardiopsis composta]MBB5433956.1 RsiW-degrading membrane proteinase PrsW (M82 family) [Nocardiopsis composta]